MKPNKIHAIAALLIFASINCFGAKFSPNASYEVCFTPRNNCKQKIVKEIKLSKKQILVQAYSFTDPVIAKALIKAKQRGVDVQIIFDKTQAGISRKIIELLSKNNIKPLLDFRPTGIAHNKVMIIDNSTTITGSYNYTKSAAKRNAENVLIIKDSELSKKYIKNWRKQKQGCAGVRP